MKRLIKYGISILAVTLLIISTFSVNTSAESYETSNNRTEFETNLKTLAKEDDKAREALEQYSELTETDKEEFIDILYSDEYVKAITAMPSVELGTYKTFHNGDIVVETKPIDSTNFKVQAASSGQNGVTHEVKVFGIFVTYYNLIVYFDYTGTDYVTKTNSVYTSHNNFNPSILVSEGEKDHWASGGWARAWGNFNVTLTAAPWQSLTHTLNVQCDPIKINAWIG